MNALTRWNPVKEAAEWNPFRELDEIHKRLSGFLGGSALSKRANGQEDITVAEWAPLVDALRLAERMVQEKKYEAAQANLQMAKLQLEAYRALAGTSSGQPVADLEKDIQKVSGEIQNPGAADKIGTMWDKVSSWFQRESGQAHQTGTGGTGSAKSGS